MVNGDTIVAQVRQGTWPRNWQVFRAKASYFIRFVIFLGIFVVLALVAMLYLTGHPNEVFTIGAVGSTDDGPLDRGTFNIWRTVDFALLAVLLLGCGAYIVVLLVQLAQANEQLLVIFPEGFVLKSSKTQGVAFGSIRSLSATNYRGTITMRIVGNDGRKFQVRLDGRFGNARQLAQRILAARGQFVAPSSWQPPPRSA